MNFYRVGIKELGFNKLNGVLHGIVTQEQEQKPLYWKITQSDRAEHLICIYGSMQWGSFACYSILSSFLSPLSYGGFYTLYRSFLIIWALHLSIIQTFTWASVPSDTSFNSLWVAVAKVALFRGLLHINAAMKVAVVHSMWWWQLLLRYFVFPFFSRI